MTITHIYRGNLESLIHLTCMSLNYGKKPEYLKGEPMQTQEEKCFMQNCHKVSNVRQRLPEIRAFLGLFFYFEKKPFPMWNPIHCQETEEFILAIVKMNKAPVSYSEVTMQENKLLWQSLQPHCSYKCLTLCVKSIAEEHKTGRNVFYF